MPLNAQKYGVGPSALKISATGGLVTSTTKSPHFPYVSHVTPNEHEKAVIAQVRENAAVSGSATAHKRYDETNTRGYTADLTQADAWAARLGNARDRESLFPGNTDDQIRTLEQKLTEIQGTLTGREFTHTPDPKSDDARVLLGTPMDVLLKSVAAATRLPGLTAADAARAISCLQQTNLLEAIADPKGPHAQVPNSFQKKDLANAWRLAATLEKHGEPGFTMIKHLMAKTPPMQGEHVDVGRKRNEYLHIYLRLAREKVKEAGGETLDQNLVDSGELSPDPASVNLHINQKLNPIDPTQEPGTPPADGIHSGRVMPAGASLLDKGVKAISNHLQQVLAHGLGSDRGKLFTFDPHANDIREDIDPDSYRILRKDANWGAANAAASGLFSKTSKEYTRLLSRTEKTAVVVRRRSSAENKPVINTMGRAQRTLKRAIYPAKWQNKSFVDGLNSTAVDSPGRVYGGTRDGGINEAQIMRQSLIWELEKAIQMNGGDPANPNAGTRLRSAIYAEGHPLAGIAAVPNNPSREVLRQMVRAAILNQQYRFNKNANGKHLYMTGHNDGDVLTGSDLDRAKAAVYDMFAGGVSGSGRGGQERETEVAINELFNEENKHISGERLMAWAAAVGAPGNLENALGEWDSKDERLQDLRNMIDQAQAELQQEHRPAPPLWNEADWGKFLEGADIVVAQRLKDIVNVGEDVSKLTETELAKMFEDILRNQRLGHLMDMQGGGWTGIKTQGISYILSHIATLTFVGLGLDLRYQHGRHSVMQALIGTAGREIFVGMRESDRGQAGVGFSFGPGHASKKDEGFSAGLAVGANFTPFSMEMAERIGALWRFKRAYSGVDSDDVGALLNGRLARKMMDPAHSPSAEEGGAWINPPDLNDQDIVMQLLHEFDVSVGWLKSETKTFKQSGGVTAVAGVFKLGSIGPAVSGGFGLEFTESFTTQTEDGGMVQQQRESEAFSMRFSVNGVLSLLAATIKDLGHVPDDWNDLLNPDLWHHAVKMAFHDGTIGTADVIRLGTTRTHSWISHFGEMTTTPGLSSFFQKIHLNGCSYEANLLQNLDAIAHDKAKVFEAMNYYRRPDQSDDDWREARQEAVDKIRMDILGHLRDALVNPRPTNEFREYWEWSRTFQQMDGDLLASISSEQDIPNWEQNPRAKARVKDYGAQDDSLRKLSNKAIRKYGEFRFPILDSAQMKNKNRGPNTFLQSYIEDYFGTRRIEDYR